MPVLQRRRLLRTFGTLAAAGSIAGCLDGAPAGGDDGGSDGPLRGDAVVDYPGIVDGGATVSGDEREIAYDEPEQTFAFQYAYEGDTADPEQLRVGRDLSGERMAAFVAPVYDEGADAFAYHVFANEAFVDYADWYYVAGPSTDPEGTGRVSFEPLEGTVSRFVVGPVDALTAGVIDVPPEEARNDGTNVTGVLIRGGSNESGSGSPTPQVSFAFDYDSGSETLEITHQGGDSVQGSDLRVAVEAGDRTVESPFEGEVTAGDRVTVEAPSDATVQIVWAPSDGSRRSVLAEWDAPDA